MIRIALFALLFGLMTGAAMAEIFRCRDAGGVLVFTDDPANFPPGCKEEESKGQKGGLTIIPESPVRPVAPPAEEFLREDSNDNLKLTTCDSRILTTLSGERKAG